MSLNLEPNRGVRAQQFRLALRLSWRDIKKHKGRSTLIAALIAVPILLISAALVVGFSSVPTTEEKIAVELGQSAGRVSLDFADMKNVRQGPQGDLSSVLHDGEPNNSTQPVSAEIFQDLVVDDYDLLPLSDIMMTAPRTSGSLSFNAVAGDVLNPAFAGKFSLLDGRAAASTHEATATPGFMERFSLKLGDSFETNAGKFTIVGAVRNYEFDTSIPALYLNPSSLPKTLAPDTSETKYYLAGSKPASWELAQQLNSRGAVLTSAELFRNPPSDAELGADAFVFGDELDNSSNLAWIAMAGLIAALVLLEVGLLAGAAFAVGTRKQQQDLKLLAASGAESSILKSVVTSAGLWLGLLGGCAGALLGTGLGIGWMLYRQYRGAPQQWLHIPWLVILAVILIAVLAGLVSALAPARNVAKQVLRQSARTARTQGGKAPKFRVKSLFLLCAALVLMGAAVLVEQLKLVQDYELRTVVTVGMVIAGAVGLVASLILLTGPLIRLLTAKTTWLPLPLRLASRDSARNLGRTVPAVAAVLAAATLSSATLIAWSSMSQNEIDNHIWSTNVNQALLPLSIVDYLPGSASPSDSANGSEQAIRMVDGKEVAAAAKKVLGVETQTQILRGGPSLEQCLAVSPQTGDASAGSQPSGCYNWVLQEQAENRCVLAEDNKPVDLADWRCKGSMAETHSSGWLPGIVVGGQDELEALMGRKPSAEALTMLRRGGAVISNRIYLNSDGTTTVAKRDAEAVAIEPPELPEGQRYSRDLLQSLQTRTLLAHVEQPERPLPYYAVISPETAASLGIPVQDRALLITPTGMPSAAVQDKLNLDLMQAAGEDYPTPYFEPGPQSGISLGLWALVAVSALITLSAAGITAGLALADGREDHSVLASIGADPRLRKQLSAAQLGLTSVLGTVLGLAAGGLGALSMQSLFRDLGLSIPWMQLAVLVIVVPLVGALVAWLFTKAQLPLLRRRTLV
ncbi:hypothetical protein AUR04nite_10270 [Glutamicibacter uratoxydans]|uniref:ABC3 transporter permease protein domain-containing protein n=1 Tax=Glutamicibacter uratoxydans TaxID=43667 RepID=A0A4Y4DPG7_GLUUR|nr:FtsX-like permease family protein [Glutamicibacter uratoxydans]GED05495.1 hypothetical protein AUR04nite_10270 [Glutamicibacter uratoxydans]